VELVVYFPLENCYYEALNVLLATAQDTAGSVGDIARAGNNIGMFANDVAAGVAVAAELCKFDFDKTGSQYLIQLGGVLAKVYDLVRTVPDIDPGMRCYRVNSQEESLTEH